jgi:transposase-like protein
VTARRFFEQAISATKVTPMEVTTDQAPTYPAVLEELLPAAWHRIEQYGNNRVEVEGPAATDAWAQTGPQRQGRHRRACVRTERSTRDTTSWPRDVPTNRRVAVALDELAMAI